MTGKVLTCVGRGGERHIGMASSARILDKGDGGDGRGAAERRDQKRKGVRGRRVKVLCGSMPAPRLHARPGPGGTGTRGGCRTAGHAHSGGVVS